MDQITRNATEQIVSQFQAWVKSLAQKSVQLRTPTDAAAFEKQLRDEGLHMIGLMFEHLLQNALDHQDETRTCPTCGGRRRHKGRRRRRLLSSVGAIRLEGTYWSCSGCGGHHAAETLAPESSSRPMQQLLCLLGTSMASFAKASFASKKLLGIRVSDATIRRLCYAHGHRVPMSPVPMETGTDLLGSCDGTKVHTRQSGWKELKAYSSGMAPPSMDGPTWNHRADSPLGSARPPSRSEPAKPIASSGFRMPPSGLTRGCRNSCPWPSTLSISGMLGSTFMRLRGKYIRLMKTRLTNGLTVIVTFLRILADMC